MKHKNYDLIMAAASGEPMQLQQDSGEWSPIGNEYAIQRLATNNNVNIRVAPKMIKLGAMMIPRPETSDLPMDTEYFVPSPLSNEGYDNFTWAQDGFDANALEAGVVHLTKDAAHQHQRALIAITKSSIKGT